MVPGPPGKGRDSLSSAVPLVWSIDVPGKIFVTRRVFDEAVSFLKEHVDVAGNRTDRVLDPDELEAGLSDVDGVLTLLTDSIDRDLMDRCPKLKVVANFAVGFNNIDIDAATERGILVTNTPGVLTETTADFAWTLMLATARRAVEGDRFVREGRFDAWGPRMLLGHDVFGKVLGIVGLGRIGQAVARRASGFGMRILACDAHPVPDDIVADLGVEVVSLDGLLKESDFVSLHVPLLDSTHHLVDDAALASMKETAILVNTSRGPIVDEKALVAALGSGTIAGAGLDVYEREPALEDGLTELDNAVLAPHIASSSHETRLRMCMMASQNLLAGLNGEHPANLVNAEAWEKRRS